VGDAERETGIPVVVNCRAGPGMRVQADDVAGLLRDSGVACRVEGVEPDRLDDAVQAAIDGGARVVGVCGGDGTLLGAAQRLAGTGVALAAIPGGTLNHFARWLGIRSREDAAAAMAAGETRDVPVGILDDRVFLNTAVLGFYADAVRRRNRLRRWLTKWPAAVVGIAGTVMRMRTMTVEMVSDGRTLHRETPLVWVGMGSGSFPRPHEAPMEGAPPLLEVVVLRTRRRRDLLGLLARMPIRVLRRESPAADPALEMLRARRILVQGDRRIGVTMDGEVFRLTPPLFLAAQAGGLRVVVPPDRADGDDDAR
jgi:diacylglycerol kinase family enzyme